MQWLMVILTPMLLIGCGASAQTQAAVDSTAPAPVFDDSPPEFLLAVYPTGNSNLQVDETTIFAVVAGYPASVCVYFEIGPLLRPGDFIRQWDRITLQIDGEVINAEPSHLTQESQVILEDGDVIVATEVWPDGEVSIYYEIAASGPFTDSVCWDTPLGQGSHLAAVHWWTNLGEYYEYTWQFLVE